VGVETAAGRAVVRAVGETAAVKVVAGMVRRWAGMAGPRLVSVRVRVRVRVRLGLGLGLGLGSGSGSGSGLGLGSGVSSGLGSA